MTVKMIWAQDATGGIGFQGDLLFEVPEDLKHFKQATQGQIVVMGRKTWDSLPSKAKPLPGRLNIVLTSSQTETFEGAQKFSDFNEVLQAYSNDNRDIIIIGGGKVYESLKDFAEEIIITHIENKAKQVDVYAIDSEWILENFKIMNKSDKFFSEKENVWFSYVTYTRK